MKNKKDNFYFDNFVESISYSCESANLMKELFDNFSEQALIDSREKFHEVENKGDNSKHRMLEVLVKAFVTPIERDDILTLSNNIDDITDCIEDVIIRFYTNGITQMRPDVAQIANLLVKCCDATKEMLEEFRKFNKSKTIKDKIVEINHIEDEADKLYIKAQRTLHTESKDVMEIISWNEIYYCFEKCFDACEHVADVVECIIIRNT